VDTLSCLRTRPPSSYRCTGDVTNHRLPSCKLRFQPRDWVESIDPLQGVAGWPTSITHWKVGIPTCLERDVKYLQRLLHVKQKIVTSSISCFSVEVDVAKRQALFKQLCKTIIDDHALIISVWGGYLVTARQKEVMGDTIHTKWTMNWTPEDAWLNK